MYHPFSSCLLFLLFEHAVDSSKVMIKIIVFKKGQKKDRKEKEEKGRKKEQNKTTGQPLFNSLIQ